MTKLKPWLPLIGIAVFDKDRCLPYRKAQDCMVCEEHCPIPDKAIYTIDVEVVDRNGNTTVVIDLTLSRTHRVQ